MTKKTFLFSFILLFSFMISCEKEDDNNNAKKLHIGVILPLEDLGGNTLQYHVKAVVDEVNEQGGLHGNYQLELDIRSSEPQGDNDRCQQSILIAQNFVTEYPNSLIGFVSGVSTTSKCVVTEVSEKNKIPTTSGYSSSESLTGISDYFHRTTSSDKLRTKLLAQQAIDFGLTKIAVAIERGDNFSESFSNDFIFYFKNLGGTITDTVNFKNKDPEYVSKLKRLYKNEPHCVLMSFLNIHAEFINSVNDNSLSIGLEKDKLCFMIAYELENLLLQANFDFLLGELNGVPRFFGFRTKDDKTSSSYKYLENLLVNKYQSTVFKSQHYDAAYVLVLAIEKALLDGVSPDDIDAFRLAINERIRLVSKPEGEIVRPEMTWETIKTMIAKGDINYEGIANNSDIDEQGQAQNLYELFVVKKNGSEFYYDLP